MVILSIVKSNMPLLSSSVHLIIQEMKIAGLARRLHQTCSPHGKNGNSVEQSAKKEVAKLPKVLSVFFSVL